MSGPGRPRRVAGQILTALVGIGLGAYSGRHLLIPLAATAALWSAGTRVLPASRRPMLPAAAVQTGHALWLAVGLVGSGVLDVNALDVVILVAGVAWLLWRPGLAPIVLLTGYQCLGLAINGALFLRADLGTVLHRALLIHLVWRVMALVLMWLGWRPRVKIET